MTQAADNLAFVREVQGYLGVTVDGWAGQRTVSAWRDMTGEREPDLSVPVWPKPDQDSLRAFYGDVGERQVYLDLPYPMRLAWDTDVVVSRTQCHELVADSLHSCIEGIFELYDRDLERVKAARMDLLAGVRADPPRRMRGNPNLWSVHSWGAAIDLDSLQNGLRTPWPEKATMPVEVIEVFEAHGWTSLGRVIGRDAMHMQASQWR